MNKLNFGSARVGHSKLKRVLRHTLLLIGFVVGLGGINAWGQDSPFNPVPDQLKLSAPRRVMRVACKVPTNGLCFAVSSPASRSPEVN